MRHFLSYFEEVTLAKWERPALSDYKGSDYSYAQVATELKKLHLAFQSLGLKPGDNVVLTGGIMDGQSGNTNIIKVQCIEES